MPLSPTDILFDPPVYSSPNLGLQRTIRPSEANLVSLPTATNPQPHSAQGRSIDPEPALLMHHESSSLDVNTAAAPYPAGRLAGKRGMYVEKARGATPSGSHCPQLPSRPSFSHTLQVPLQYNRTIPSGPNLSCIRISAPTRLLHPTSHPIPPIMLQLPVAFIINIKNLILFFLSSVFLPFSNSDLNSMALLSLMITKISISFGIYRNRLLRNTVPYCSTAGF